MTQKVKKQNRLPCKTHTSQLLFFYNWLAVLKSVKASLTRAVMVFSPSRTQTRGLVKYLVLDPNTHWGRFMKRKLTRSISCWACHHHQGFRLAASGNPSCWGRNHGYQSGRRTFLLVSKRLHTLSHSGTTITYCKSVSKLTLITPFSIPCLNSSLEEPEPPWKTRNNGFSSALLICCLV